MSRYDYTKYPPVMPLALIAPHLTHPKPPHKLRYIMPPPTTPKDAIEQIRSDVAFSESQSTSNAEAAVITSINALKLLLLEIDTLRKDKERLDAFEKRENWALFFESGDPDVGQFSTWVIGEGPKHHAYFEGSIRATIDAAMKASQPQSPST